MKQQRDKNSSTRKTYRDTSIKHLVSLYVLLVEEFLSLCCWFIWQHSSVTIPFWISLSNEILERGSKANEAQNIACTESVRDCYSFVRWRLDSFSGVRSRSAFCLRHSSRFKGWITWWMRRQCLFKLSRCLNSWPHCVQANIFTYTRKGPFISLFFWLNVQEHTSSSFSSAFDQPYYYY